MINQSEIFNLKSDFRSLLQTPEWSSFKSRHGWQVHEVAGWSVLERSLPFGQRFLYAPELTIDFKKLPDLLEQIRALGQHRHTFAVRLEFIRPFTSHDANYLKSLGLRKSFEEVQPEFRQWIDIGGTEDEILSQMKPKARYNIRLAERKGVVVGEETDPAAFVALFGDTARRQGFSTRSMNYYTHLIAMLQKHDLGSLIVARFHDESLAAIIVSWYDGLATYLYGASSTTHRDLMAPHLAHWHAIQLAKSHSCTIYDLLAVAPPHDVPPDTYRLTLVKKYVGLTRFKQQLGGETVHLLGSWDLILHPVVYQGFKFLETRRR